jgi:peptidoglycan/LPS O-acetylase OafA/YrhL
MEAGWSPSRRPGLDALRGVAILLVIVSHAASYNLGRGSFRSLGSAGVTIFFTLSGFLITSLFVADPRLGRFYRNRAVRLLPALALAIAGFGVIQAVIGLRLLYGVGWVIGYLANWRLVGGHTLGVLDVAWSLSVEEQFYVVWPLLLLATRRWPRLQISGTAVLLAALTVERFALFPTAGEPRVYWGSDTAAASLLVGCLLALALRRGLRPVRLPSWVLACGWTGLLALACVSASWNYAVVLPTVASWWTGLVIWGGARVAWRPLCYAGERSYALYLWHAGLLWLAVQVTGGGSWPGALVTVALVVGIAEVSWRLVEQPARRRWHAYAGPAPHPALVTSPSPAAPNPATGHAGLALE